MKKRIFTTLILVWLVGSVNGRAVQADIFSDYQSTSTKLSEVRAAKEELSQELEKLSNQLTISESQLADLSSKIATTTKTLSEIDISLSDRRGKVEVQESVREAAIRDFYKSGQVIPLVLFISSEAWSEFPQLAVYYQSVTASTKATIGGLNDEIKNFEANKQEALALKNQLAAQAAQVAILQDKLRNQASDIKNKLSEYAREESILGQQLDALSSQISSQMSWQQSAALSVKESGAGRANTPNPEGAPSWRIVGYGTEHGVGMSQWGAFMLAEKGWDAERILRFYYQDIDFKTVEKASINVEGYGQMAFEDEYLAGIGETDPIWYTINKSAAETMDQVQIIAARTYAINKSSICTTQACQVYVGGTAKKEAVEKTLGKVMTRGGQPIAAFYFSTSGPHTDDIGDSPSFAFDGKSRVYKDSDKLNDDYPYLRKVEFNDSESPFNNWSSIIPNSWRSQSFPPKLDSQEGTPIGQIDMEDVLNTSLLNVADLGRVDSHTGMDEVRAMLKKEGKVPIEGLRSVGAIKMGGSSNRVKWITAEGSNRNISEGEITGIRFRYAFNVRSPEKDWIYSTWFEFK